MTDSLGRLTQEIVEIVKVPYVRRIEELERQLDSARAWAVNLEQEVASLRGGSDV